MGGARYGLRYLCVCSCHRPVVWCVCDCGLYPPGIAVSARLIPSHSTCLQPALQPSGHRRECTTDTIRPLHLSSTCIIAAKWAKPRSHDLLPQQRSGRLSRHRRREIMLLTSLPYLQVPPRASSTGGTLNQVRALGARTRGR